MKKTLFSGFIALIVISQAALAQGDHTLTKGDYTQLKTLSGFTPTILKSDEEALRLYQNMPTQDFKGSSGCFQRAHNWAYQLERQQNIKSMKVFLYFTHRYQREFDYDWFYHVAPVIPVRTAEGIVPKVFDPTFTSAPSWSTAEDRSFFEAKPLSIQAWTRYFVIPEGECPLVENYSDFEDYQERFYCYTMLTPMFTYIPGNIAEEPAVRTQWRKLDLEQMLKAFRLEKRE